MTNTSNLDAPEHIRLDPEELSRLLDLVCIGLGVPSVWDRDLIKRLTTLVRGFKQLAAHDEAARKWEQAMHALMEKKIAVNATETRELSELGVLLAQQPGNMSPPETRACLSLACRAFAASLKGTKISDTFFDGLKQLFNSQTKSWGATRGLLTEAWDSVVPVDDKGLTDTCLKFLRSANVLRSEPIHFPDLRAWPDHAPVGECVDAVPVGEHSDGSASHETKRRQPTAFETSPDLGLFEFQIVQQEHEPALNGYRLTNDWNSLTTSELKDCSRILLGQLRTLSTAIGWRAIQLHAACRFLSQLAQLTIEKLASLPIFEGGTMHLDLRRGLLRRDIMEIAPRTDRSTGQRWEGQWLKTPVPPEIMAVLTDAANSNPEARTIGDLLVGSGLNPTRCHELVNSGRKEPRTHESLRIARSLRPFMLAGNKHPATVSRLLGDITVIPRAHHYYLLLDQSEIHSAINWWCEQVGLLQVPNPEKVMFVGSHKVRCSSDIQLALAALQQANHSQKMTLTTRSSLRDAIEFHNAFMCRYTLQLNWALGARCQNLSQVTVSMLLGDPDHVVMADRVSDRYSTMRVCPLTSVLKLSRLNLVEHLRAMSKRLLAGGEKALARELETLWNGTNPDGIGFPIIFKHKKRGMSLRPATRADLKKVAKNTCIAELNEPRHFLITELDRLGVASVAIDALVGHHQAGAPPFGFGSGMGIKDFSIYTADVLEKLHKALGVEELTGLGRSDPNRKKLADIVLPKFVPPPPSLFLNQRVAIDDFNPPDILLAEEDCPVSMWTLPALNKVRNLRAAHLKSEALSRYPWGAVCFCLVTFDLVINASDLKGFYSQLSLGLERHIGKLVGVEVTDSKDIPLGQCLMSRWTCDALQAARRHSTPPQFELALHQMGSLLRALDKHWSDRDHASCLQRLQSLAAHASLFELPPTARFGIIHKAPFVPLRDIDRIAIGVQSPFATQVITLKGTTRRSAGFKDQLGLVKKWSGRDEKLGEYQQRANGLIKELQRWSESCEQDEADQYFFSFVCAELGRSPPFRKLSLPVLHTYLQIAATFFEHIRIAGDLPRTPSAWEEFLPLLMSQESRVDGVHRWVGLHVGAWLNQQGISVPKELMGAKATPANYRPHLSVYVTAGELAWASKRVSQSDISTPWDSWMDVYLQTARFCPMRPAELRFLKASDVSSDGQKIHIQPSGHIHLKTITSKGLISIPEQLRDGMLDHKVRRTESPAGLNASMFVPSRALDYSGLDKSIGVARSALKEATGRSDFRMYDLRACSISDLIFNIPHGVKELVHGLCITPSIRDARALDDRFKRCALAAREARQMSCFTTLRYYNLGGLIEGRWEINQSIADLQPSAKYLATIKGVSEDAIYSQRYRVTRGANARQSPCYTEPLSKLEIGCVKLVPLETPSSSLRAPSHRPILARLLELGGLSSAAAADEAGITLQELQTIESGEESTLFRAGIRSVHGTATRTRSTWFSILDGLAKWAFQHRREFSLSLTSRPKQFHVYGSKISFREAEALLSSTHLWAGLHVMGIEPIIFFANSVRPSDRTSIRRALQAIGAEVATNPVARQSFAALRFRPTKSSAAVGESRKYSNHQQGKVGRLVVAAICLAVDIYKVQSS